MARGGGVKGCRGRLKSAFEVAGGRVGVEWRASVPGRSSDVKRQIINDAGTPSRLLLLLLLLLRLLVLLADQGDASQHPLHIPKSSSAQGIY